jgi:hypothetical protein
LKIADSLEALGRRIDRAERRERERNEGLQRRQREQTQRAEYDDQMRRQGRFVETQAIYDDALSGWGGRAPAPSAYETERGYRLRLLDLCTQKLPPGHDLKNLRLELCDDAVISAFEPQILAETKRVLNDAASVPAGETRAVRERTAGAADVTRFVGSESFVKSMMPEARRVIRFCDRNGGFRD